MIAPGSYLEKTYAAVLFELADEADTLRAVKDDLDCWTEICNMVKDFEKLIVSPYFSSEHKQQFVHKMLSGKITDLTMNFLEVVIRHDRTRFLPHIITEYNKLWDARAGYCPVEVTVAKQISNDEVEKLAAGIASTINCKVKLKLTINPEILGGVIIRYDDKVVDNTVKGRLHKAVETIIEHGKGREINEV
ncbi:MAG: ATP synthase F1 subunit delta [Sedimentisphaerales bacterium]